MREEQGLALPPEVQQQIDEANRIAGQRSAESEQRRALADQLKAEIQRLKIEFNYIFQEMDAKIMNLMPLCESHHGHRAWQWRLNGAVLEVAAPNPTSGHPDVLMHSSIAIEYKDYSHKRWTHSLWYNRVERQWQDRGFAPSLSIFEAHIAVDPATIYRAEPGQYWPASSPVGADKFIEEWIGRFARAASGNWWAHWKE